jgi:glucose-1-phosphate adenylyltransferase
MRDLKVTTMVLAGGVGERLYPLTSQRSKPAVPFGGTYRIIDFTLMNCVLSGIHQIYLLTQYHSLSLGRHVRERWNFFSQELGGFAEIVPPKMRTSTGFYRGTADAIYRNLDLLDRSRPDVVLVLSGDHIYRADYSRFTTSHLEKEADISVLTGSVPANEASAFGVIELDRDGEIQNFVEKPKDPSPYASGGKCTINLGVYCFRTEFLVQRLVSDSKRKTAHDFGKNILPGSLEIGSVFSCPLAAVCPDPKPYWRDVGTIDSYFRANMDLLETPAAFDLEDSRWPEGSRFRERLPARISAGGEVDGRYVHGRNLVSSDCTIEQSTVVRSILSPGVRIGASSCVSECIVFPGVEVGEGSELRRVVVEEGVRIPPGTKIGLADESRRFSTSPGGVVVVSPGYRFDEEPAEAARTDTAAPRAKAAIPQSAAPRGRKVGAKV